MLIFHEITTDGNRIGRPIEQVGWPSMSAVYIFVPRSISTRPVTIKRHEQCGTTAFLAEKPVAIRLGQPLDAEYLALDLMRATEPELLEWCE